MNTVHRAEFDKSYWARWNERELCLDKAVGPGHCSDVRPRVLKDTCFYFPSVFTAFMR